MGRWLRGIAANGHLISTVMEGVANVKPWIREDVFKTWTDAQKRLWESLCAAVPFQPPPGVELWRDTYLKNLNTWEAAVKKTLIKEAAWVEEWVQHVAQEKGTPEVMNAWVRQMEEVLQRWIQTQNQWWDDYFAVLRRGGALSSEQREAPAAVSAATLLQSAPEAVTPPLAPVAVAAAEPAAAQAAPVSMPEPAAAPAVEADVAAAEKPELPTTVAMPEAPPAPTPAADDLKLISGIGPALEKKLNACGVLTFRDLALLSDADIERIEAVIKFAGRIRREDWPGQARALHAQKYQNAL